MKRVLALFALSSAFALLPGCAWFLIGGAAAVLLGTRPADEAAETPPAVFVTAIAGPVSGDVDVPFTLSDPEGDPADVQVHCSTDGTAFSPATPVTGTATSGLVTSPDGVLHHFLWDSLTDLGTTPRPAVWIRISPSGAHGAGAPKTEGPFAADNNGIPVASGVVPGSPYVESISIAYVLADPEGDAADVIVEWRAGATGTFQACTAGAGGDGTAGLATSAGGTAHSFVWNSEADTACANVADAQVRITPRDAKQGSSGSSAAFLVANNDPPAVQAITVPASAATGTATVEYVLTDTHADTAEIQVQFKRESDGTDWDVHGHAATPDATIAATATQNRATSLTGVTHLFPWDSDHANDLRGEDAQVKIRIRARDAVDGIWGAWVPSALAFGIANDTAPVIAFGVPSSTNDRGLVYVPYTLSDVEGDEVTIVAEYKPFGAAAWRTATAGPGTTALFRTAPVSPVACVFAWETPRDGLYAQDVEFRLTASQAAREGQPVKTAFKIQNDGSGAWVYKAPLPSPRYCHGCATLGGTLYVAGGHDGTSVLATVAAYDPATDAWTSRAPMPTARTLPGCAAACGRLYVIGGSNVTAVGTVEAYDPASNTWSSRASMPTARYALGAAAVDDTIYAAGGTTTGSNYLANFEAYDARNNSWSSKAGVPTGRHSLACASSGGKVFAAGGTTGAASAALEIFDPKAGGWSLAAPMSAARFRHACAEVGGRICVAGGSNGTIVLSSVEEYDFAVDTWVPRASLPATRDYAAGAAAEGKFVVPGGWNGSVLTSVVAFDPIKDAWRTMTPMPTSRYGLAAAAVGGTVFAVGGYAPAATGMVEAYDPLTDAWTASLPMPTPRGELACAAAAGKVYCVGGHNAGTFYATVEVFDAVTGAFGAPPPVMPTVRRQHVCVEAGGKIYAIGGAQSVYYNIVEEYDPSANTWRSRTPMSQSKGGIGGAAVDGIVYVCGGYNNVPANYDRMESYDPATNTWTILTPMPSTRSGHACAVIGGKIYAAGGTFGTVIAALDEYDPAKDTWTMKASMSGARRDLAAASVGRTLFAIGGRIPPAGGMAVLESYEPSPPLSFFRRIDALPAAVSGASLAVVSGRVVLAGGRDASSTAREACSEFRLSGDVPSTGAFEIRAAWAARESLNRVRRDFGTVVHNGLVWAAGGFDDATGVWGSMESFDPSANSWSGSVPMPTPRGGLGFVAAGGKFYAAGGQLGSGAKTGVLEIYDPATSTWSAGASMSTPRSHFGFAFDRVDGFLYAFGGEDGAGNPLSSIERYNPATNAWTTLAATIPEALEGVLCLPEGVGLKLFGGQRADGTMSDRVLEFHRWSGTFKNGPTPLPYAARDLFGCTAAISWTHRGTAQSDEFCLLGGGFDGTAYRDGFYRFCSR